MLDIKTIKAAKPREKPYKLTDGNSLVLVIHPNGSKYWRMRYRWQGKESMLGIGVYPEVSIREARLRRDKAKASIADGVHPGTGKKPWDWGEEEEGSQGPAFEDIALQWHAANTARWTHAHAEQVWATLEADIFPQFGETPISEVGAQIVLQALKKIEARGSIETAKRVRQRVSAIFQYGIASGVCEFDPASMVIKAMHVARHNHMPALTDPREFAKLWSAVSLYPGKVTTRIALQFLAYTVARPGEIRHAEWVEFDLAQRLWRIPAKKMKRRLEHLIPLSRQALKLLDELKAWTGHSHLLFPGDLDPDKPISENTLACGLNRLGYKSVHTAHGFRSSFSTIANEAGKNADHIEAALAHVHANKVRAAYRRSTFLEQRRELMQWWAEQLDSFLV